MKILLVNDTSLQRHMGCFATMNAIRRYLHKLGAQIIECIYSKEFKYYYNGEMSNNINIKNLIAILNYVDIIIINGEGSLHDENTPEILFLLNLFIEYKKKFFVVNSYIRSYPSLIPYLKYAEGITVRDRASEQYLSNNNICCSKTADAAIFSNLTQQTIRESDKILFTDQHGQCQNNVSLFLEAISKTYFYFPFRSNAAIHQWPNLLNDIYAKKVISGRYHGCIFSILAGSPLVILPSNTSKMIDLANDYSLCNMIANTKEEIITIIETDHTQQIMFAREKMIDEKNDFYSHPLHILPNIKTISISLPKKIFLGESKIFSKVKFDQENKNMTRPRRLCDYLSNYAPDNELTFLSRLIIKIVNHFSDKELDNLIELALQESSTLSKLFIFVYSIETSKYHFIENRMPMNIWIDRSEYLARMVKYSMQIGFHLQAYQFYKMSNINIDESSPYCLTQIAKLLAALRKHKECIKIYLKLFNLEPTANICFKLMRQFRLSGDNNNSLYYAKQYLSKLDSHYKLSYAESFEVGIVFYINQFHKIAWKHISPNCWNYSSHPSSTLPLSLRSDKFSLLANPDDSLGIDFTPYIGIGIEIKYAAMLSIIQKKCILRCDKRMHSIISASFKNVRCIAHGVDFTKIENVIDYAELALLFEESSTTLPFNKYLKADPHLVKKIRKKYLRYNKKDLLVGLAWFTPNKDSGQYRNIPLSKLINIIDKNYINAIQLVSLQSSLVKASMDVNSLGFMNSIYIDKQIDPIKNLDTYVNQIAAMDLILSIDCSVVHIAGALGIPCYLIHTGQLLWGWNQANLCWYKSVIVTHLDVAKQLIMANPLFLKQQSAQAL